MEEKHKPIPRGPSSTSEMPVLRGVGSTNPSPLQLAHLDMKALSVSYKPVQKLAPNGDHKDGSKSWFLADA